MNKVLDGLGIVISLLKHPMARGLTVGHEPVGVIAASMLMNQQLKQSLPS